MVDVSRLRLADVVSYLGASGWQAVPGHGPNAVAWALGGRYEVLVPLRDDLGDRDRRLGEALRLLSVVEGRTVDAVAADVASPLVDHLTVAVSVPPAEAAVELPTAPPDGWVPLPAALQVIEGTRDAIAAAARFVDEGAHAVFSGRSSRAVGDLLDSVSVTVGAPGFTVTTAVPVTPAQPDGVPASQPPATFGRRVAAGLHDAVVAAEGAVRAGVETAFDATVDAGVSAGLCTALGSVGGHGEDRPFSLGFRWGRGLPSALPARVVEFPAGSSSLLRAGARRLGALESGGAASVVGLVEGLHDDADGADRWRVRVRGELATGTRVGDRRGVWVRLAREGHYDEAMRAHRAGVPVRASGVLDTAGGRAELRTGEHGFEVLDDD